MLLSNIVSYSSLNVLHHRELITLVQNKVQYLKIIVPIQCNIKSNIKLIQVFLFVGSQNKLNI